MVKGVSKTIIEVNNTGSKFFEKIVFYVTPQYGNLSAKQLKRAASNFSFNFEDHAPRKTLRKAHARKRFAIASTIIGVCVIALAAGVIFI